MNMKWKITMMGSFTLRVRGKEINLGATMGKQIASIFAYLILHRDRAVAKEQLIEIFWPDSRNPLNEVRHFPAAQSAGRTAGRRRSGLDSDGPGRLPVKSGGGF